MNVGFCRLPSIVSSIRGLHRCNKDCLQSFLVYRSMSLATKDMDEELKNNPYYAKYAAKIDALQQTSPEDFNLRVEECQKSKSKPKFGFSNERGFSSLSQPKEAVGDSYRDYQERALSDVMKTELIEDLPADEISKIWESHFKHKDAISATIPSNTYKVMYERGKTFPTFVLPLPRGQGYEFFLCQVKGHEVHFTSLINYQAHKENAPECLTMIHYTDIEDKGIVLMHGEYNKDVLEPKEAQCLANQFQLYYGKNDDKKLKLLERLNCNPNDFKHMDLIAELESLSL